MSIFLTAIFFTLLGPIAHKYYIGNSYDWQAILTPMVIFLILLIGFIIGHVNHAVKNDPTAL